MLYKNTKKLSFKAMKKVEKSFALVNRIFSKEVLRIYD